MIYLLGDITFGQYFPGKSIIHRIDPRMKIILLLFFIIFIFVGNNFVSLALSVIFVAAIIIMSKIPFKMVIKSVKPIIPIIIFTSLLNIFYIKGDVIFEWWIISITKQGLYTSLFVITRIILLILGSSMLTYTTTPTALTDGLERLLSPFAKLGLKVHELAMMMTIALRFIPTLIEETEKIMNAQKARGADMEAGNIIQRIKAIIPVLIPLFISSFRRAYELAMAMECRCYQGGNGRTRMKQLHMSTVDYVSLIAVILFSAAIVASNFIFPKVI